jgi:hypothetical protein
MLSEEEVRSYLLDLRDRGAARGTFKANHFGIQFLYRHTLNCDWALFAKKRFVNQDRNDSPMRWLTPRFAACLAA